MGIKFEKKFKIENVFNKNDDYHLWITSIGVARQDLFFVNNQLSVIIDTEQRDGFLYFAKMSVAHVNEALAMLKKAESHYPNIWSEFKRIKGFQIQYEELVHLAEGDEERSFYKKVLSDARNNFFHYNKGSWNNKEKEYDFKSTKSVLQNMCDENFMSGYKLGDMKGEHDYYFAEEIQINWLFELGRKEFGLTENELLYKISTITAKVMGILSLILKDFFDRPANRNIGYNTRYK